MAPIPNTLPVLPLVEKVLLPSIITKLVVTGSEAKSLSRKCRIDRGHVSFIVCIPLNPGERGVLQKPPSSAAMPVLAHDSSNTKAEHYREEADISQLFHFGCVAQLLEVDESLAGTTVFHVQGVCRSYVEDILFDGRCLEAKLVHYPEPTEAEVNGAIDAKLLTTFRNLCWEFVANMQAIGVPEAMLNQFSALIDRCPFSSLANLLLCVTESSFHEKLHVLEITDFRQRLHGINQMITRHLQLLKASKDIQQHIGEKLDRKRREFCLRQQFHFVESKSNPASTHCVTEDFKMDDSMDHNDDEFGELVNQLKRARLPAHARSAIHRDVNRLRKLPPSSAESSVLRIYLEWVADLPWKKATSDIVDLRAAEKQLDHDHFGLGHVKRRILEYLSVVKVKQDLSPPILCFVGPPGVGKTTLGISIATALQRKFHRIALGGIRDEAEIRGHRRTYVGALPGVLIQSLKKCGVNNPLILLDEIDKIVQGTHQGDPAAALLEVLDPAQNSSFTDHFLHIPFDLSQVMFIATANSIESIPEALLDRMEVIDLHGYTFEEKLVIAKSHLVPNQLSAHGLNHAGLHISDEVLLHLVEHYTRESGVRQLDRRIASVCRYKCREYANLAEENMLSTFDTNVNLDDIEKILGLAPFENEIMDMEAIPGLVNGLAYSRSGIGSVLQVETNQMPGQGDLKLTGSLGEVIRESALIAISWVRANAYALHLTNCSTDVLFKETDIHIHLPNGAVPKDGPSAGVTLVTSIISLLSGKPVPRLTAMTGEITLRGQVRPVGGIKEKVLSAHRAGITKIILPILNRKEVMQDVPKTIRNDIHFVFCKHIWEVVQAAFDPYDQAALGWEPQHSSRL